MAELKMCPKLEVIWECNRVFVSHRREESQGNAPRVSYTPWQYLSKKMIGLGGSHPGMLLVLALRFAITLAGPRYHILVPGIKPGLLCYVQGKHPLY